MRRSDRSEPQSTSGTVSSAALTPLLDTLFLLLFALLALAAPKRAEAQSEHEEVRVQLPAVETGPQAMPDSLSSQQVEFAVEIDAESNVLVDSVVVSDRASLDALLAQSMGERLPEEVRITLRTDREAKHGVAVELLQYFRVRGIVDVELVALGGTSAESTFGGDGR